MNRLGEAGGKLKNFKIWFNSKQKFRDMSEFSKGAIIVDGLLHVCKRDQTNLRWVGIPTCIEWLETVYQNQVTTMGDWAPPIPNKTTIILNKLVCTESSLRETFSSYLTHTPNKNAGRAVMKEVKMIKNMISVKPAIKWNMANEKAYVFNVDNTMNSIINTISEHEKVIDEENPINTRGASLPDLKLHRRRATVPYQRKN